MRNKMLFGAFLLVLGFFGWITEPYAAQSTPPDFTQPYRDSDGRVLLSNASGTRDLLFICIHPLNGWPMMNLNEVREITNMAQRWFAENSQSHFLIDNIFILGCGGNSGTYNAPPNHRQNNGTEATTGGYYWTANGGHHTSWVDAIQAADSSFNFSAYDTNGDKKLSGGELAVAIVRPHGPGWGDIGFRRTATVSVDGIRSIDVIDLLYERAANDNTFKAGLLAHEMMHQLLGAGDMYDISYGMPDLPFDADLYSIMDQHGGATHLDPFHKLKYGWLNPTAYRLENTSFILNDVERTGNVAILYDPSRGTKEYFIVENRLGSSFDSRLPDEGVLVWHIIEDHKLAKANSHKGAVQNGWSRYAIRLLTRSPLRTTHDKAAGQGLSWADFQNTGFKVRVSALGANSQGANWAEVKVENGASGWTGWTSEEKAPVHCNEHHGATGFACKGGYCDNVNLYGSHVPLDYSTTYWSNYFSEEGPTNIKERLFGSNLHHCFGGFGSNKGIVTGISCSGGYCDNISLQCTKPASGTLTDCWWSEWLSEEQVLNFFGEGNFITAV
jgi:M6 family metalloprotease-like protein